MKKPELLSPAGTLKNMRYAFAYGADAVYAGQPRYSLRVRQNDFKHLDNLKTAIDETHTLGKKFFLATNLLPHNAKLKTFIDDMEPIIAMQPDALIMADPGLIMLVRERWSDVPIHLSVQANTMNYAAVKFWKNFGLTRIILSREISLDDVAEIREQCPDIELEVFIHGALCIAYSGRCLLSGYMNHRDANQGTCTNACRWEYKVQEPKRPDDPMPIMEDENGTYIMNSKDLRAVQHVEQLMDIGIDCLKIEGRTKSHYYAARTAQVYRQAIDNKAAGKPFDMNLMAELEKLANRGYTEGFFRRHVPEAYQNYETGNSLHQRQQFVGEIISQDKNLLEIDVKNRFSVGDRLELMSAQAQPEYFTLEHIENKKGESISVAPGSGHIVRIRKPINSEFKYGLLLRELQGDDK
ncbi:peptidase U32 family protein [Candidatus Marithrix sp. Canyon 246]|uniref:peptidase U32 family protein n=1 Tax=Candidatus Marithrix sp. Canyon 246 TaxID=1827136 RepID=UPI00084A0B97|nr:U32 family peptidase [Candidatus Marithrix sp. Canyon 246]